MFLNNTTALLLFLLVDTFLRFAWQLKKSGMLQLAAFKNVVRTNPQYVPIKRKLVVIKKIVHTLAVFNRRGQEQKV